MNIDDATPKVRVLFSEIVRHLSKSGAAAELEQREGQNRVQLFQNQELVQAKTVTDESFGVLFSWIREFAECSERKKERFQTGKFTMAGEGSEITVEVTSVSSESGQRITLRFGSEKPER
jgi:hypothetical protein